MGRIKAKSDYEELRNARIAENQARLASLGLQKTLSELRNLNSSPKSEKTHVRKKWCKVDYSAGPLRRSSRLNGKPLQSEGNTSLGLQKPLSELRNLNSSPKSEKTHVRKKWCKVDCSATPLRRLSRLSGKPLQSELKLSYLEDDDISENGHILKGKRGLRERKISEEVLSRRCESKGRGSVYDPVYGISCHFCRQKKLCGEEDCKRCGEMQMDQPCTGKTDCSACHSGYGIHCRACLKIRYGEEMEDVKSNKNWMCPHCIEEKGVKPYWICNSSICLKKRNMVPTGIAIYRAREMGYKSVAHLLMDELQRANKRRL